MPRIPAWMPGSEKAAMLADEMHGNNLLVEAGACSLRTPMRAAVPARARRVVASGRAAGHTSVHSADPGAWPCASGSRVVRRLFFYSMRILHFVVAALSLAGCATPSPAPGDTPPGTYPLAPEQEVVAVAEALFSAMRTRDTAAIRDLFVPEMQIVALRAGDASTARTQGRSVSEFITSIARPGDELKERMWDPQVQMNGDLAALWAPYDFHVGERFSHCGYDAFHLVRQGGRWKILALTYTVQTTGCATAR